MTSPPNLKQQGPRQDSRRQRDEAGVVVPSRVMLVAIAVVLIAGAMYLTTSPKGGDNANAADKTSASASAAPTKKPATRKPSASPSATAKKSSSATRSATPSSSASASTAPKPKPKVRRGQTYVEVFNNTRTKGLAGRTAHKAEGVGWNVVGSDNWYGTIPTTTVYYPQRLEPAAKVLARDLGIRRVKPTIAPMRGDRLTVILTSDYSS